MKIDLAEQPRLIMQRLIARILELSRPVNAEAHRRYLLSLREDQLRARLEILEREADRDPCWVPRRRSVPAGIY